MSDADFRLDGRRAVVTGAARGIGRAIAERLAVAGAHVVVADREEAEGNMAVASIEAAGGKGAFISLDVTDPELSLGPWTPSMTSMALLTFWSTLPASFVTRLLWR